MANKVVFLEATLVEIALGAAVEYALKVASSVILLMNLEVLFEVGTTCKFLVAVIALKGLFPRVDSLMPDQVAHLTKSLVAALVVALVGLLLVMDPSMLLER